MLLSSHVIGVLFDGYRVLKRKLKLSKWFIFIIDVLFGLMAGIFTFLLLLRSNNGQLRFYLIIGLFIGLWMYYFFISVKVIKVWFIVFEVINQILKFLKQTFYFLVIKPVKTLYLFIVTIVIFIVTLLTTIFLFFRKIISYLIGTIIVRTKKSSKKIKNKLHKKEGFSNRLKKLFRRK